LPNTPPLPLPNTIAIDGPAGSGKSTLALALAETLDYHFIDTGAFYRAVTLQAISMNLQNADEDVLEQLAHDADLDLIQDNAKDEYRVLIDGKDITRDLRSEAVERHVSRIAALKSVRDVLNAKYRTLAQRGRVIMAGRDIGTEVLPNADFKLYLDASPEVRALRRCQQTEQETGRRPDYEATLKALRERDAYDSNRAVSPLRRPPDSVYMNTDDLDMAQVIDKVHQLVLGWATR
jgi:CMP/dCMP kinase